MTAMPKKPAALKKPTKPIGRVPGDKFIAYGYYISSEIYTKKLEGEFIYSVELILF